MHQHKAVQGGHRKHTQGPDRLAHRRGVVRGVYPNGDFDGRAGVGDVEHRGHEGTPQPRFVQNDAHRKRPPQSGPQRLLNEGCSGHIYEQRRDGGIAI